MIKGMRVAVGLSGGVDSSVAALLLKEQGHEVVGVTMKLWRGAFRGGVRDACFGPGEAEDIARAESLARRIGIDYHVFDLSEQYEKSIVRYFRESYLKGETPNPCVRCNAAFKFGLLPRLAAESGVAFDRFATGHYARVTVAADGRTELRMAADRRKDQSYFLCRLSQEQLARHLFPLGGLQKAEVRAIARRAGLDAADKADSQDFYSGDADELIGVPDRPGAIVDAQGRVMGRHRGYWHYTVGQRRGLGLAGGSGEPYYVVSTNACRNEVVVGRMDEALATEFSVGNVNWVSVPPADGPVACRVRVRSAGALHPATLHGGRCLSEAGIFGVAPGQSAVFYGAGDDDRVLCGGTILGRPGA